MQLYVEVRRFESVRRNIRAETRKYETQTMDQRHQEDDAAADAGRCRTCQLTSRLSAVIAATILVLGFVLCLVFVRWTAAAAAEVDQTSKASGELKQRLQQCEKERRDVNLMLLAVTQDSRCRLCPGGWLWWRAHCYFFSVGRQDDRQWNESAEFCLQHNSSLAVIKDSAEMEFIQGEMGKFALFPFLWVGLTDGEQEGRWRWWDGTDVQHYMPVTVEWDDDHRDCADLRGGGSLFASSCEAYGPWACKRAS